MSGEAQSNRALRVSCGLARGLAALGLRGLERGLRSSVEPRVGNCGWRDSTNI
ncbi:hypothetical protein DPMN_091450 [Dreissena polymorpha]|uniref:Uncharacterized protein n=1 Tax=Dreissena polymorpha TaxID=45954 RepID=A0A9D4QZ50_DREPO|nr:hypothetical protein DPMN_091450 [Dreissena polymorpha]